ncbi:hypothetical protein C8Q75DRAFT_732939 [Abortiporus biennis]|nr:hypothetical protein C8Q75DRAFT_732939 [Abortiporus biennis]
MSSDISWMKKGLKKRPVGEWFSEKHKSTSSSSSRSVVPKASENPTRLDYGKLSEEDRNIPKYKTKPVIFEEFDATSNYENAGSNMVVMTTQPSRGFDDALKDNPDGWTECLILAPSKTQILNTPGFPQPLRRPPTKPYEVRQLPGRGKGVIALQDINAGDLIIVERPLVISLSGLAIDIHFDPDVTVTEAQKKQAVMREYARMVETLVSRMDPELKAQFMDLANSHEHDGSGPLFGRIRTNGFSVSFGKDNLNKGIDDRVRYSAVGNDISRVNHSCCPNSGYSFHRASFGMELRATRKISKGEEVTCSYIANDWATTAERQKALEPYDFVCTCPACSDPENDSVRSFFQKQPSDALPLDETLKFISTVEGQSMEISSMYDWLLNHAIKMYAKDGDKEKEKEFKEKLFKNQLVKCGGENAPLIKTVDLGNDVKLHFFAV